jgi:hypothetical protein
MALSMVLATGCDDDDDDVLAPPVANEISKESGDNQTVPRSSASQPLVVVIEDQYDDPMSGVTVNWAVATGSGTLSSATSVTDVNGETSVTFTAGTVAGTATVTATVSGLTPVTFTITIQ